MARFVLIGFTCLVFRGTLWMTHGLQSDDACPDPDLRTQDDQASLLQRKVSIDADALTAGTKVKARHARLRQHLLVQRKLGAVLVDELVQHMETGRLKMWDPDDEDAIEHNYICELNETCDKDGGVDNHLLKLEQKINNATDNQKVLFNLNAIHSFVATLTASALMELLQDSCVTVCEQDHRVSLDDPGETTKQTALLQRHQSSELPWGLDQLDGDRDSTYSAMNDGTGVYIYILDTGVQITHTEFQYNGGKSGSRALAGADFTSDNTCGSTGTGGKCDSPGQKDCTCGAHTTRNWKKNPHGTHCAGTAAGRSVGVARNATVVSVQVLNHLGNGEDSWILAGMNYAIEMKRNIHPSHPAVISMSIGAWRLQHSLDDPKTDIFYSAVNKAKNEGVVVVVAAGNHGGDADDKTPAHIDNAVTVCATDAEKKMASFSGIGRGIDVCAPGVSVYSSITNESDTEYDTWDGTSMAAPHIAGIMALMLQHNPKWSYERQIVELTTNCVESDTISMDNVKRKYKSLAQQTPQKLASLKGSCAANQAVAVQVVPASMVSEETYQKYKLVVTSSKSPDCPTGDYLPQNGREKGDAPANFWWKHADGKYVAWYDTMRFHTMYSLNRQKHLKALAGKAWWFSGSVKGLPNCDFSRSNFLLNCKANKPPEPGQFGDTCVFHYEIVEDEEAEEEEE